jgi:hypothetical protein
MLAMGSTGCAAKPAVDFPGLSVEAARARAASELGPTAIRAYLEKAYAVSKVADPLEACRIHPDLPGNSWPKGLALQHCELSFGSGITAQQVSDLLAAKKVDDLESLYAADQARHFSKKNFSEAIHGDFYFFDGGAESERMSALWVQLAPKSPFAAMSRGNHLMQLTRRIRAARTEGDIPEDELQRMYKTGEESAAEFRRAASLAPKMIEAYNGLAHVGTVGSAEGAEEEGIAKGNEVDPLCAPLAMQEMWALMPRWGGTREAMGELAGKLAQHVSERPLVSLAMAMPAVEDADQIRDAGGDNWQVETADLLRPYALVTTSPEVSAGLAFTSCCGTGSEPEESLVHAIAGGRFGHGQVNDALVRARALGQQVQEKPDWPMADVEYALEREPNNSRAHLYKGNSLLERGQYGQAQPELRIAMEDPELRGPAMFLLVRTLLSAHAPNAREVAEQYHSEFPEYEQEWLWIQAMLRQLESYRLPRPQPQTATPGR